MCMDLIAFVAVHVDLHFLLTALTAKSNEEQ